MLGKQLREKNEEQNKPDGGARGRTEACKLFRSSFLRFKFSSTISYVMRNQHLCDVIIIAVKGA